MTASWFHNRNGPFSQNNGIPTSTAAPRQVPGIGFSSIGQQQQSQQGMQNQAQGQQVGMNGMGGGPQQAVVPNQLPHAGNQADLNYLWSVIQDLSDSLAQNRAQTASIISNVQRIQSRSRDDGALASAISTGHGHIPGQVNGDTNGSHLAVQIADLQAQLHTVTRQRDQVIGDYEDLARLKEDYENTLENAMNRIREYAKEHALAIVEIHRHYNGLLEQEREANLTLRLEHAQWQASLGKAAELARLALRARSEETAPMDRRMRELKAENKVLRRLLGWKVEEDSEDEEERRLEEEERRIKDEERLRARQGASGEATQPHV